MLDWSTCLWTADLAWDLTLLDEVQEGENRGTWVMSLSICSTEYAKLVIYIYTNPCYVQFFLICLHASKG